MVTQLTAELQEQGRGFIGALLVVGVTFLYTMESWQLAQTLPMSYLLAYAVFGLGGIVVLAESIGFRQEDRLASPESSPVRSLAIKVAEILCQSLVAAYVGLFLLGVVELSDPLDVIARLGLLEFVPLGFGAALANQLVDGDRSPELEGTFPRNVVIFAAGAVFVASTIALTQEVALVAIRIDWMRTLALVVASVVLDYLVLYELQFKGQQGRVDMPRRQQIGTAVMAYAVSVVVAFVLLAAYGQFLDVGLPTIVERTIVLSFPASLGAAGAEVVL